MMGFDYYAYLAESQDISAEARNATVLVSGFVDKCTVQFAENEERKNEVRNSYMRQSRNIEKLSFPDGLSFSPNFENLPASSWLGLEVYFTLQRPWYSKDDRAFHVLDNPLRKDRVFGVPYMSAASWKGLLRWACRMRAGLRATQERGGKIEDWKDPSWILHLFGNEKSEGDSKKLREGALVFYPTWFSKIDFEVINPHNRARRAGTQPIYYEVVPPGTPGVLYLLYTPLPRAAGRDRVQLVEAIEKLLEAIEDLLTIYGISAKRTAGWGTATIDVWKAYKRGKQPIQKSTCKEFWSELKEWLQGGEDS